MFFMCVVTFYAVVLLLSNPNRLFPLRPQVQQLRFVVNYCLEIDNILTIQVRFVYYSVETGSVGSQLSRAGSSGYQFSVEAGNVLSYSLSVSHSSPNRSSISSCVGASHSVSISVASIASAWTYGNVFITPSSMKCLSSKGLRDSLLVEQSVGRDGRTQFYCSLFVVWMTGTERLCFSGALIVPMQLW